MEKKPIRSYLDLEVYRTTYDASVAILTKIIQKLPREEQFDLAQQLRRSTKAIPRLIAEAYAKKHQKKGFQGLIDDALGESNETAVSLGHVKDVYHIEVELCNRLLDTYDMASRQLYNLALAWSQFKERRTTKPTDPTDTQPQPNPKPLTGGV